MPDPIHHGRLRPTWSDVMANVPIVDRSDELCVQCGASVGVADRFCPSCGAPRVVQCPACGAFARRGTRRCPDCGGPLPHSRSVLGDLSATGAKRTGRGLRLLIASTLSLLVVFGMVAWIYFSAPERRQAQPVSQLPVRPPLASAILPGNQPVVYVSAANRLLVSNDGGESWNPITFPGVVNAVGVGKTGASSVYAAGAQLWRESPGGFYTVTTTLPTGSIQALAVDPTDANRLYALVVGQGLFQSDDGGRIWARLGNELPAEATSLTLAGNGWPLFFVGTAGHGLFASADGHSWVNANGFVNGALPTQTILAVAFDPHSGDRYVGPSGQTSTGALYAATDLGLFKSIDQGQSWSALALHQPIAALAVSASGPRLMLAMDPSGQVYRSRDGGVSWN
jgi:photosystem II stability/assembly factor-like uncharacterized protein/predicted RNA-binding Zn-ribbon protein involved in translation (DUF1610 family)